MLLNIFLKKNKNEAGIAVLLSILVLVAILGLVVTVSNISFRITKSNQSINESEKAFFAAETAAELTIYDIVRNNRGLDLPDLVAQPLVGTEGATWDRQVRLATLTPGLCSAPQAKSVCTNSSGAVTSGNPLIINLEPGESFEFDLNIATAPYPNQVRINWSGAAQTRVLVSGENIQSIDTVTNVKVPASGVLDPNNDYRIRIINDDSSLVVYDLTPQGGGTSELPLGLNISATGFFLNTERRLEVFRPSWLIY